MIIYQRPLIHFLANLAHQTLQLIDHDQRTVTHYDLIDPEDTGVYDHPLAFQRELEAEDVTVGVTFTDPGGLLALESNMGRYSSNQFDNQKRVRNFELSFGCRFIGRTQSFV